MKPLFYVDFYRFKNIILNSISRTMHNFNFMNKNFVNKNAVTLQLTLEMNVNVILISKSKIDLDLDAYPDRRKFRGIDLTHSLFHLWQTLLKSRKFIKRPWIKRMITLIRLYGIRPPMFNLNGCCVWRKNKQTN